MYLAWLGDVDSAQAEFEAVVKRAVIRRSVAQMAVALPLNAIPVVGQILSAMAAVGFKYINNKMQQKIKEAVEQTQQWANEQVAAYDAKLQAVEAQVADEESKAATLIYIAQSLQQRGVPVQGLGDIWSTIGRTVQKKTVSISKAVVKPIVQLHMEPLRLLAKATGQQQLAKEIGKAENVVTDAVARTATPAALVDPEGTAHVAKDAWQTLTGQKAYYDALEELDKLKKQILAQLEAGLAEQTAIRRSDSYRAQLRDQLVQEMVDNNDFALVMIRKYAPEYLGYFQDANGNWIGPTKPMSGLMMGLGAAVGLLAAFGAAAAKR